MEQSYSLDSCSSCWCINLLCTSFFFLNIDSGLVQFQCISVVLRERASTASGARKETVDPEMKTCSNTYDLISSVEYEMSYFQEASHMYVIYTCMI